MARRVRQARRAQTPTMHQSEAARMFGLSQSAFSRLENGETQSWKRSAIEGAALLLGITTDEVRAGLEDTGDQLELNDLRQRLETMSAELGDVRNMLLEVVNESKGGLAEFGALVQAVRTTRGYTISDTVGLMGPPMNRFTLDRIEQGRAHLPAYLDPLSRFLGVPGETIQQYAEAADEEGHQTALAEMVLLVDQYQSDLVLAEDALTVSEEIVQEVKSELDKPGKTRNGGERNG